MVHFIRRGRPNCPSPDQDTFIGALANVLRQERLLANLTIQEVSDLTGGHVSLSNISHLECGVHEPKLGDFLALCMVYGVRPTNLMPTRIANMLVGKKQKPKDIVAFLERVRKSE